MWFMDELIWACKHSHVEASNVPAVGRLFVHHHHRITRQCCSIVISGNVKPPTNKSTIQSYYYCYRRLTCDPSYGIIMMHIISIVWIT